MHPTKLIKIKKSNQIEQLRVSNEQKVDADKVESNTTILYFLKIYDTDMIWTRLFNKLIYTDDLDILFIVHFVL